MYFYNWRWYYLKSLWWVFCYIYILINVYMIYRWIILMMKPLNGHVLLYMYIYLHDHDYVMDFYLWWYYVILRALMDDLWQRSHMGRCYFHSTEAVRELIAREEWLGCKHDVAHVGHAWVNTSVGSMYFSIFYIKPMYMYNVFKIYM